MRWSILVVLLASCASTPPAVEAPTEPLAPLSDASQGAEPAPESPALAALSGVQPWRTPEGNLGQLLVPDGERETPLTTERLEVRVTVHGRLARTEVTQIFRSHLDAESEGIYSFVLPRGAAIGRLAMDVSGVMMEGELVERERARQIYEDIVNAQKDPALLEWTGGNRFKTQIFPIPGRGTKTVILTYEELLPEHHGVRHYRYALPRLEQDDSAIGSFHFSLQEPDQTEPATVIEHLDYRPREPIALELGPTLESGQVQTHYARLGEKSAFVSELLLDPSTAAVASPTSGVILAVDSSAGLGDVVLQQSRELGLAIVRDLPDNTRFEWIYGDYDQVICTPQALTASELDQALPCIEAQRAGGATHLEALLRTASERAQAIDGPVAVVLISDGVASLGEMNSERLMARAVAAIDAPRVSLHTVAVGHRAAISELHSLAGEGGGHALRMAPDMAPKQAAQQMLMSLEQPMIRDLEAVVVSGESLGVHLLSSRNVPRGLVVTLAGQVQGPVELELRGSYQGHRVAQRFSVEDSGDVRRAWVARTWARAEIAALEARPESHREAIVALSLEHGVMSSYTSFLVLENEEAYARYNVDRRRADGMVEDELSNLSDQDMDALGERYGAGGMGMQGSGRGGGGSASYSARGAVSPRLMAGAGLELQGSLDKSVIRERIRQDGGAIQQCYEDALSATPQLAGKLVVHWTIEASGAVVSARVYSTTLEHDALESCVLDVVGRWTFPAGPGNGTIKVIYPFVFTISESGEAFELSTRIEALQMQDAPTLGDHLELLELLVTDERDSAAAALYATHEATFLNPESMAAHYERVSRSPLKARYPRVFRASARGVLSEGPNADVARALSDSALEDGALDELETAFLDYPVETDLGAGMLGRLEGMSELALGERLLASWEHLDAEDRFHMLQGELETGYGEAFFDAARVLAEASPHDETYREPFIETGARLGHGDVVVPFIEARCTGDEAAAYETCRGWLQRFPSEARAVSFLATLARNEVKRLRLARRDDMSDADLIVALTRAMLDVGLERDAARALSEIVEFAPHSGEARRRYAKALSTYGGPAEACGQYARAAQIDPAERSAFQEVAELRRAFPEQADVLRQCVVEGVSLLPVKRDISLVLTWEDDSSDVDLHVIEPGGEEVSFEHMASEAGGLLYYDETGGYGPEIYVMGGRQTGEYTVQAVYYSGSAEEIRGTLTVLRDAGSASETREAFPFVLKAARGKEPLVITTL